MSRILSHPGSTFRWSQSVPHGLASWGSDSLPTEASRNLVPTNPGTLIGLQSSGVSYDAFTDTEHAVLKA